MSAETKDTQTQQTQTQQTQQTDTTHPEDNGASSGKTFTQEEVNKIVAERLARERSKAQPSEADLKVAEQEAWLEAKERELAHLELMHERRLKCAEWGYPEHLADYINFDAEGDIRGIFRALGEAFADKQRHDDELLSSGRHAVVGSPKQARASAADSALRSIFGLKKER